MKNSFRQCSVRRATAYVAIPLLWALYWQGVLLFWSFYASHHLLLDWAISALLPEHHVLFYGVIYTHDIVVNVLLALPFCMVLRRFEARSCWGPVVFASVLLLIWSYHHLLTDDGYSIQRVFSSFGAWLGAGTAIGLLPLAYYVTGKAGISTRSALKVST